jgi:hypothetical protein
MVAPNYLFFERATEAAREILRGDGTKPLVESEILDRPHHLPAGTWCGQEMEFFQLDRPLFFLTGRRRSLR